MTPEGRPLISMVMIAKDEEANIDACFKSWWGHVDEAILVDTGSSDRTVERARQFAKFARQKGQKTRLKVSHFEWCDDFAAARNYADSLATGEWTCWTDLDDVIEGAERLREIAENAAPETNAIMFDYDYAQDSNGNSICVLKRERLVRRGASTWKGRVHEAQDLVGQVQIIPPQGAIWRHRKPPAQTDRNLRILEKWAVEEPTTGRVIQYLGTERAGQGQHEEAVEAYRRYLELDGEPDEHRAQVWRKLACSLIALERVDEAFDAGLHGLADMPSWPDSYLTLAQTSYIRGDHKKVLAWGPEVLKIGQPNTLLIVNPLDYTVEPRVVIAGALAATGKLEEAVKVAEEALSVRPDHPLLRPSYDGWRITLKRMKTVETWLACSQMLCKHDEQEKALALLEDTVPYYATDAPEIVQARSELRERLRFAYNPSLYAEHYVSGGSKPEDMVADEKVTPLCEYLPRVQFLKRHIEEMLEAA